MSVTIEDVREEVEDAIRRKLHIRVPCKPPNTQALRYPEKIEGDVIVMRDSDCGPARPTISWTPQEWRDAVGSFTDGFKNLWIQVGFWSFELATEPAVDDINFCHTNPAAAGRRLFQLRKELEALRGEKK